MTGVSPKYTRRIQEGENLFFAVREKHASFDLPLLKADQSG
jgi:hypothetical protein